MNNLPSYMVVEQLRKQYPIGIRVQLVSMDDPYTNLKPGDQGCVTGIDDAGTIFVKWDKGSRLGLVYGEDRFLVVDDRQSENIISSFTPDKE